MNQIMNLTNYLQRRINMRCVPFAIGIASFVLSFCLVQAQTAADLKETIESHYTAINAKDRPTILSHHLPDFTWFSSDGSMLINLRDFIEAKERVGATRGFGTTDLFIHEFKAQIYGNVGVAIFYLIGSRKRGDAIQRGTWRVTAVWVHENGTWKEAHHHESPLVGLSHQ